MSSTVLPATQQPSASVTDWIAVFAGALGALMATLDISITNSALPQIQGEIGATGTEGTWISTGYLLSEIVMIPLAAWLSRLLGLRNFLMWCALLFICFSVMCGTSGSLTQMIIGRVGQGFVGGAMIPTAQMIIRTRLPRRQLPLGMSIFGVIVILGPVMGPVLGGWLAENVSWNWCFFLNLPVGIGLMLLLFNGLPKEKPHWEGFMEADWLGIIGMSVGLSCLTVVLEEGQRDNWFDSTMIVTLSIAMVLGFILLSIAQLTAKKPVIRLSLLRNPRYVSVLVIVFVVGMGLYCVLYLLPQFLSGVAGYNSQQSGMVLLVSGVPSLIMMPILPRMLRSVDTRLLVICGVILFAVSCFLDISLTAQSTGDDFFWSQLLRGAGQIMAMMPLNQASMAAVNDDEVADAAGIYNMMRNLGGSVGLALLGIFIDRQRKMHDDVLRESVTANSPLAESRISGSASQFFSQTGDMVHAKMQAMGQLANEISQQALVMTYSESFFVLGMALVCCIPLALLLRAPRMTNK
ncbi:DHA2 family efflux MFS transporter permease subunit [Rouxiella badensis]|uniref:DHA2 family efflux MFS transporter permease subunit n=1 Tax=Rouxiella badensis TaxID=1646377 RepID=UPI0013EF2A64|nr:DHA2 family efflux MFS transporter permease subunit [Rouxiella badensis]QII37442.1 DHA2 family efflux MFS transporter permease subunit [Rouxiella badensis]